jgi:hypothetical protein
MEVSMSQTQQNLPVPLSNQKCNRNSHRYAKVAFVYTDDKGINRKATAVDASMYGAKFQKRPWFDVENPKEIKELSFDLNGTKLKASSVEECSRNENDYIIRYQSNPQLSFTLPNVLSKIEALYSEILNDLKNNKIFIPPNRSRQVVISLLGGVIISLLASAMVMVYKFKTTAGLWNVGVSISAVVILSVVLSIYAIKSQKDLQEYVKNDRRIVIANYLEQVMVAFSILKSDNEGKIFDKLQRAGGNILETFRG